MVRWGRSRGLGCSCALGLYKTLYEAITVSVILERSLAGLLEHQRIRSSFERKQRVARLVMRLRWTDS